ncbi:MAG: FAD-binding protein [Planctomycetota bacterium]
MRLDFETSGTLQGRSDAELRDALVSGGAVRLAGSGSQQLLVPAPATKVRVISLQSMDRILRLESDDLTCTVEAGVRREALDAALQKRRLQLPCAGGGTIGGLFAADVHGPLGPGMHSPRSLRGSRSRPGRGWSRAWPVSTCRSSSSAARDGCLQ